MKRYILYTLIIFTSLYSIPVFADTFSGVNHQFQLSQYVAGDEFCIPHAEIIAFGFDTSSNVSYTIEVGDDPFSGFPKTNTSTVNLSGTAGYDFLSCSNTGLNNINGSFLSNTFNFPNGLVVYRACQDRDSGSPSVDVDCLYGQLDLQNGIGNIIPVGSIADPNEIIEVFSPVQDRDYRT